MSGKGTTKDPLLLTTPKPKGKTYTIELDREAAGWVRHFALERKVPEEAILTRLLQERLFIFRMPLDTVLALHNSPRPLDEQEAELAGLQTMPPEPMSRRKTLGPGAPRRSVEEKEKDRF